MKLAEPSSTSSSRQIDISYYIDVLLQYWRAIALFMLCVLLFTAVALVFVQPTYRATATLLIESQANNAVSIEEVYAFDSSQKEYYQTQFAILQSNHIAEKVIQTLGLANNPPTHVDEQKVSLKNKIAMLLAKTGLVPEPQKKTLAELENGYRQEVLDNFKQHLSIEPIRNTQLVRIHFISKDPALAAKIANAIGEAYIASTLDARLIATEVASSWLTSRVDELRTNLKQTELKLAEFLTQEQLIDINGIDELAATELTNLTIRLSEAKERRSASQSIYNILKNSGNSSASMMTVPEISNHPQVRDVKIAETDAERKVSELAKRYGPKHDKMIQAYAELYSVRSNANRVITDLAIGIEKELNSAIEQEETLRVELAQKKVDYQNIINKRAQFDSLKRDVETNRQLYELFLNREKETQATSDFQAVNARFSDVAKIPATPYRPQPAKILIFSCAFAALIAIFCAFLADAFRKVIDKPREIEEKLGLNLLGFLPEIPQKHIKNKIIDHSLYRNPKAKIFSETVRNIRTSLLMNLDDNRKLLMVSSCLPNEGKTTLALNLAQSLAAVEKTLLIDCDLRLPSIATCYGLPSTQVGLTDFFENDAELDDYIYRDHDTGLEFLAAGTLVDNPLELLSGSKFKALIKKISENYDRVVFDAPPLLAVSDGLVLGHLIGGVVLVIKAQSTTEQQINDTLKLLRRNHIPVDGVVLNQVDSKYTQQYQLESGYYNAALTARKPQ